jgi:tRNA threonylcarbamoyladenosine biosynthesis protein TsaE
LGETKRPGPDLDVCHQELAVVSEGHGHPLIVKNLVWTDEAATQTFAAALADQPGVRQAIVELRGELGAGKTTLVRHLLRALGVQGRIKSPTYAVVEPYTLQGNGPALDIWHFDFYRFTDPREWEDAGFRDHFAARGLKLAEWPENAHAVLPPADLRLHIEPQLDDTRQVRAEAGTPLGQTLLTGMLGA